MKNIFDDLKFDESKELVSSLFEGSKFRIERILSNSSSSHWYDQDCGEWVCLVDGWAVLEYDDGSKLRLNRGDTLYIPAHKRHRVESTSKECVWLCVFEV